MRHKNSGIDRLALRAMPSPKPATKSASAVAAPAALSRRHIDDARPDIGKAWVRNVGRDVGRSG